MTQANNVTGGLQERQTHCLLAQAFLQVDATQVKRLVILGSTGSIGRQTLQVVARHPERFEVLALAGHTNTAVLLDQIQQHHPKLVSVATVKERQTLQTQLKAVGYEQPLTILCNDADEALTQLATLAEATHVLVGVVGMVGLPPTLAALQAGKLVMTANKETFVSGGHLVQPYLPQLLPLDSEHSSLFQCLQGHNVSYIERLWLTASGGPFLRLPLEAFADITPAQALKHPKWTMGSRISIDSATLLNKGLEVIEAYWQFGLPPEKIAVVVHPQSCIHGLVEWVDGSYTAHLGPTDMRLPLQYGLSYPQRWPSPLEADLQRQPSPVLGLTTPSPLELEPIAPERTPCLRLAQESLKAGVAYTCALNAADEVAVQAFLNEQIRFVDIPRVLEGVLTQVSTAPPLQGLQHTCLADALVVHQWATQSAKTACGLLGKLSKVSEA